MRTKIIIIFFIFFLFNGYLFAIENSNGITIPFEYPPKSYLPMFTVKDDEGRNYNLLFDSGYSYCAIFSSALEKIENGKKILKENTENYFRLQYPEKKDSWIKRTSKEFIKSNHMGITFHNLRCEEFFTESQLFTYTPDNISDKIADGIVGMDFFHPAKNLTIDYINKQIIIDGEEIIGTAIPMEREEIGLYSIQIYINDIKQTALLDTGADKVVLRNNYNIDNSELTSKEKFEFIYKRNDCRDIKPTVGYKDVFIQIGDISRKLRAYSSGNVFAKADVYAKRCTYVYNLLGYDFFSENVIQFDFENKIFRIGEVY